MTLKLKKPSSVVRTVKVISVDADAVRKLIGFTIRDARSRLGLTQHECCLMLGVGRPQLANIETGRSFLSAESLVKAVVNLNLTLDATFFGVKP